MFCGFFQQNSIDFLSNYIKIVISKDLAYNVQSKVLNTSRFQVLQNLTWWLR